MFSHEPGLFGGIGTVHHVQLTYFTVVSVVDEIDQAVGLQKRYLNGGGGVKMKTGAIGIHHNSEMNNLTISSWAVCGIRNR